MVVDNSVVVLENDPSQAGERHASLWDACVHGTREVQTRGGDRHADHESSVFLPLAFTIERWPDAAASRSGPSAFR